MEEMIQEPTRFRGTNIPSCLDWILSDNPTRVSGIDIDAPLGPSDHSLITLDYDCTIVSDLSNDKLKYSYYNGNYDEMREYLREKKVEDIITGRNTQQGWDTIDKELNGCIERSIPKKKFTTSNKKPWYGRDINKLSNAKRKAWIAYKKLPTNENWHIYTIYTRNRQS